MSRLSIPLLIAALAVPTLAFAQSTQPSAPSASPAASAERTIQQAVAELKAAKAEYAKLIPSRDGLLKLQDAAYRASIAEAVAPLIRQIDALETEVAQRRTAQARPGMIMMTSPVTAFEAAQRQVVLLAVGSTEAVSAAKAASTGSGDAAYSAQTALAAAEYFSATTDDARLAAVEKLSVPYKAAGAENEQVDTLLALIVAAERQASPASQRLGTLLADGKPGKFVGSILRQRDGQNTMKAAENKPVVMAGKTIDGKDFTTESLKGKVVVIDFWASWCGPCKAELPRLKELYAKYHEQGFEIVGISNDYTAEALERYLASDPSLSWPNLFEAPAEGSRDWHPITRKYKITGIPQMFIIDKKGVLRSTEARSKLETLIPQLLAEPG